MQPGRQSCVLNAHQSWNFVTEDDSDILPRLDAAERLASAQNALEHSRDFDRSGQETNVWTPSRGSSGSYLGARIFASRRRIRRSNVGPSKQSLQKPTSRLHHRVPQSRPRLHADWGCQALSRPHDLRRMIRAPAQRIRRRPACRQNWAQRGPAGVHARA